MAIAVTSRDLVAMIEQGRPPALYDVRPSERFASDHVPGAVHARGTSAVALALGASRAGTVVLICDDGQRSRELAETASQRCARTIGWLEGGMAAWTHERPRVAVRAAIGDIRIRNADEETPRTRPALQAPARPAGALGLVASWFNAPMAVAALVGTAVIVAAAVRLFMWE